MIYGECNFHRSLGGNMLVKISWQKLSGLLAGGLRPPLWVGWGWGGVGVPQPCHPSTNLTQGGGALPLKVGTHCQTTAPAFQACLPLSFL